jgi:hypothetical protein
MSVGTRVAPTLSDRVVRAVVAVTALVVGLAGCGARSRVEPAITYIAATPAPTATPREPPPIATQYRLTCRDRAAPCPDGVGLFVRPADPDAQRCTVVLVAPDRALTASHCLAPSERRDGARCDEIWIGFASIGGAPMEWTGCAEVLRASEVGDDDAMRRDVALVRLARAVARTIYPIDARPPEPGSIVSVLAVRPHPIYPLYHELYERLCRVATVQSAVETFGEHAASVGWLIDCPSYAGNSGSPVIDARGRVRSLLHGGSAPLHGIGITSSLD